MFLSQQTTEGIVTTGKLRIVCGGSLTSCQLFPYWLSQQEHFFLDYLSNFYKWRFIIIKCAHRVEGAPILLNPGEIVKMTWDCARNFNNAQFHELYLYVLFQDHTFMCDIDVTLLN